MRKRRRLNRRGKKAVLILLTFITSFLVGWGTITKADTTEQETKISSIPAKPLSLSSGTKKAFASSKLHQSIQYKQEIKREQRQHQKAQNLLEADRDNKDIYLTFDDGPSSNTNQLLDVLDQYNAQATFFMLGPNIQSHPSVVKRIVKEDFGVGLHGITHDVHKIYNSKKAPLQEMTKDQQILHNITGSHSRLVRLPYGSIPYLTVGMRSLLDQNGFKIWDWNVDSKDWELKDQRFVHKTIHDIQNLKKKGEVPVVLMHDSAATIRYLPQLLNYLEQHGYQTKKITNKMPPLTFQCEGRCHSISS
ncbi:polysaccharide deacetylase family protein [Tuberibacillus sp. Marseille-P3662]|uniref:polysaccharide deacetylase family protein n=1 Tax=Tuberibacillus sp. Marseille-P3662 TaxID=1965358 RepID=UPI000A1C8204|nr:polysaccharide deacetylase family protein [Tuberibacillus sp. Marseille-P3662]